MKHIFYSLPVLASVMLVACAATPPVADNADETVAGSSSSKRCELMPAIVEKTCVAANAGDQYAILLLEDQATFDMELESLQSPYREVVPLLRKLQKDEALDEAEIATLQSTDLQGFTQAIAAVVRFAQQLSLLQQQNNKLQQEISEQQTTIEKQAELIKRLKELSLGQ